MQENMLKMIFLLWAHYQIYRAYRDQNLLHISQKSFNLHSDRKLVSTHVI